MTLALEYSSSHFFRSPFTERGVIANGTYLVIPT